MAQDDDFEFLKLLRPSAQSHEFEQPAKRHVAQRHEHDASYVAGRRPNSTHKPDRIRLSAQAVELGYEFLHPSRVGHDDQADDFAHADVR